jgi:hypothetical protein
MDAQVPWQRGLTTKHSPAKKPPGANRANHDKLDAASSLGLVRVLGVAQ